jgi:hypothetical protein
MAKLPYTFTICPDNEPPKLFTAASTKMLLMVKQSVNGDLTIDDRRNGLWQSWERGGITSVSIEDRLHDLLKERK